MICTKIKYASDGAAMAHARKLSKKMDDPAWRPYLCPRCGQYHLTRMKFGEFLKNRNQRKKRS